MIQRYSPKIQVGTAKTIAKNLLTTKTGKKVSDTKLKEFMKKDKDLKKFVYSSKKTTITKSQAKKFFDKVVSGAKESGSFKVSRLAKKMGIKDTATATSDIQMNKVYQHASTEEYNAQPHDTGPTPKEIQKGKRREKMMQTIHKRDRADDIQREKMNAENQADKGKQEKDTSTNRAAPLQASGGATLSSQTSGSGNQSTATAPMNSNVRSTSKASSTDAATVAIFPLENQSSNIPQFKLLVEKIDTFIIQHITTAKLFTIVLPSKLTTALRTHRLDAFPPSDDNNQRAMLAESVHAGLFISSTMSQKQQTITITVILNNTATQQQVMLGQVTTQSQDLFELERQLGWQITNALNARTDPTSSTQPTPPVTELPI